MFKNLECTTCLIRPQTCFNNISETDLKTLNQSKLTTLYKKGQVVFHEGRVPTGIYCLQSGKIKVSKIGIDGKEQIVRFAVPGSLLGIRALVSGREYRASASTLEDSIVCFIDKKTFFGIITTYPEISQCILLSLSDLLEEAEKRMTSMAQKPVRERVAETLLLLNKIYKTENCPVERATISISREDLANIVGTATETVIRILSLFKEENLISIVGRKIVLTNIDALKQVARFD
ncbi:MAG: Crp/Fnr family transcriptional regulator [Bacteroidetes bacterium]|nr:Crp/Fnr family transcriptional regulator [Bacteroidota bacterium]